MIKLPGEIPFDLYGDSITEDKASILGTVYDGEIDEIKDLIQDSLVNEHVRGQGAHTLLMLALNGILDRGEVSTSTIDLKSVEMELKQERGVVISRCKRNEHNKFITDAIESMSWWACFKDENEKGKSNELLNFDYEKARKVLENLIKGEIIKIGRNDSCPCGSGKKYKKCCGK